MYRNRLKKRNKYLVWIIVILTLVAIAYLYYESKTTHTPVMTAEQWNNLTWQQTCLIVGMTFGIAYLLRGFANIIVINTNPRGWKR